MGLWGDFMFMMESFPQPLRVLLDTNVYGLLATVEPGLVLRIHESNQVRVYGCAVVRKELRETPSHVKIQGAKLRVKMLVYMMNWWEGMICQWAI